MISSSTHPSAGLLQALLAAAVLLATLRWLIAQRAALLPTETHGLTHHAGSSLAGWFVCVLFVIGCLVRLQRWWATRSAHRHAGRGNEKPVGAPSRERMRRREGAPR